MCPFAKDYLRRVFLPLLILSPGCILSLTSGADVPGLLSKVLRRPTRTHEHRRVPTLRRSDVERPRVDNYVNLQETSEQIYLVLFRRVRQTS